MRTLPTLLLAVAACRGGESPAPKDTGPGATVEARVCDPVKEGVWSAIGAAFGMPMETTIYFDPETCEFASTDWSMSHPSRMTGGVIDGDQVTLYGTDAFWSSCTGTLTDGVHMEGDCADAEVNGEFLLDWRE